MVKYSVSLGRSLIIIKGLLSVDNDISFGSNALGFQNHISNFLGRPSSYRHIIGSRLHLPFVVPNGLNLKKKDC